MRVPIRTIIATLALGVLAAGARPALADNSPVIGHWKTFDGQHRANSIVEIYEKDGTVHGRIARLLLKAQDAVCEHCKGALEGRPLVGLDILTGMQRDGQAWRGGKILDPHDGNSYDCELRLDGDGNLDVKGSLLFFSKTKVWEPVPAPGS